MDVRYRLSRLADNLYGELRGYNRWKINKRVLANASRSPQDIEAEAESLFHTRVLESIARFPDYAAKVRAHRGSLPRTGDSLQPVELPLWTKADQTRLFQKLGGPPTPGAMIHSTGGSTATPVKFYVSRPSWEWRLAVFHRGYIWAGSVSETGSI